MNGLTLFIISILVFPCLFPEVFVHWSQAIRAWLHERRRTREQETVRWKDQDAATEEWLTWADTLPQRLVQAHGATEHFSLLAQALATGQRYLQAMDQAEASSLYQKTEVACQSLENLLQKMRSKKKGQALQPDP